MRPQDDTEIKDDNTEKDTRQTEDDTVSLRTIIRERALEDDVTPTKNITFKKIIGGDFLNNKILRKTDMADSAHYRIPYRIYIKPI